MGAVAKDPRRRYPSARAMQNALRECVVRSTAPRPVPRVASEPMTSITVDHRRGSEPSPSWSAGPVAGVSSLTMAVAAGKRARRPKLRRVALIAGGAVAITVALIASSSRGPRSPDGPVRVGSAVPELGTAGPCVEFEETVRRLESCEMVPPESRAAMKSAVVMMRETWASPSTPRATRDAIGRACHDATAGLLITVSACRK